MSRKFPTLVCKIVQIQGGREVGGEKDRRERESEGKEGWEGESGRKARLQFSYSLG
jgi:hypothetical protein